MPCLGQFGLTAIIDLGGLERRDLPWLSILLI